MTGKVQYVVKTDYIMSNGRPYVSVYDNLDDARAELLVARQYASSARSMPEIINNICIVKTIDGVLSGQVEENE